MSAAPVEVRYVRGNGLTHRVRCYPGDARRAVWVLHGYLDAADSFARVCAGLAARGRAVYAPDFRGHGGTDWAPAGSYYHFADYVADLDALVRALTPAEASPQLSLVAHSMGGSVATLFAGARPERVGALVLLEGMGPPEAPPEVAPERLTRWLDGLRRSGEARSPRRLANLDDAVQRLRVTHGGAVPEAVLREAAGWLTQPHPEGEGLAWRFDPLHQTTSPTRYDAAGYEQLARRVTAPALLVDAGASGMSFAGLEARQGWYANARVARLEGASHMMHWTQPAALTALCDEFLAAAER